MNKEVIVIGAGLAGSEAAYQLAERGIKVKLYEMRPKLSTEAHKTENFAELVCSNSLGGDHLGNASGLMKEELRLFGSLLMKVADEFRVPAGQALAVDRNLFSEKITNILKNHPNIEFINEDFGSLLMKVADEFRVPAGQALAVDRNLFSEKITNILKNHPNIEFINEELKDLLMKVADEFRVPAGQALAVDRNLFSEKITNILKNHPNIEFINEELKEIPMDKIVLIASGPLTSPVLSENIKKLTILNL